MQGWQNDDLRQASLLAEHLKAGGTLPQLASPVALERGEVAVTAFPWCRISAFIGADVEYQTLHNKTLHPVGMAIHLLVHMPINEVSKQRAARKAAPRWRGWLDGRCVVTTRRILVDDGRRIYSWWFNGVARTEIEPAGFILLYHEGDPVRIDVGSPWYLAVLVYHLAWAQVLDVPEPEPEPALPPGRRRGRPTT